MEQLKRWREARGLSQTKLAARADVNPATVNQIEGGKRTASPATLHKLADALDVSLYELLEGEPSPKAPRRSSPEPSLLSELEGERREATEVAMDAARRQAEQDRKATNRTLASEGIRQPAYFKEHENEAVQCLLEYPPDELAGSLMELANRIVQLEAGGKQRVEAVPSKEAPRRAPA